MDLEPEVSRMLPAFHLSLGVHSIEDSIEFFTEVLGAKVLHRDASGYVNIDMYGSQITLKRNESIRPDVPDFHFGVNLNLEDFNTISRHILQNGRQFVQMLPEVWDEGSSLERKKMYLKCPTGYLIELKGYK